MTPAFDLTAPGRKQDFRSIAGPHSAKARTDVWLTPQWVLDPLGKFDLDPCAAPSPRPWATADNHIELPRNGLTEIWGGRVWLNPPYGTATGLWLKRLADHGNGIALIFARTDTAMFSEQVFSRAHAILFLLGRLTFCDPSGRAAAFNAGGPSCLIAYGRENSATLRVCGLRGHFINLEQAA